MATNPKPAAKSTTEPNATRAVVRQTSLSGKVVGGMTMSLDGFVCDRNRDITALYPDMEELRETAFLKDHIRNTGAVVMGRTSYEMFHGDVTDYEFQTPMFVVTHKPPPKGPKGTNAKLTVTFVTGGVAQAVARAKAAAKGKDVTVVGGPNTLGQLLQRGLVDELGIGIVPILLGDGLHMFGDSRTLPRLERLRVVESPNRTDVFYKVLKA